MKTHGTFMLLAAVAALSALPASASGGETALGQLKREIKSDQSGDAVNPAVSAGAMENLSDAVDSAIEALHRYHEKEFKKSLSDLELWDLERKLVFLSGIPVPTIPFERLVDARSMCSIIADWNFLNFEDERHQELSTLARKLGNKFSDFAGVSQEQLEHRKRGEFAEPYWVIDHYTRTARDLSRDEIDALASALIKIADLEERYIQRDFVEQLKAACAVIIEDKNGTLAHASERRAIVIKAAEDLKAKLTALR